MTTPDIETLTKRLAPVSDADAGAAVSDAARTQLADHIMNTPPPTAQRRAPRRLVLATAALTVVVGSVAVAALNRPGQDEPRALAVTDHGDYLIVKIADPYADPKRYNKEFKRLGMDVRVRMVPVSPSYVGQAVSFSVHNPADSNRIKAIVTKGGCKPEDVLESCWVGVRISKSFEGESDIWFGRTAKQGEFYYASAPADTKGEALYGMRFRNRRVSDVLQLLTARDQRVTSYLTNDDPHPVNHDSVPGDWYVHDVQLDGPGKVQLWVGPEQVR